MIYSLRLFEPCVRTTLHPDEPSTPAALHSSPATLAVALHSSFAATGSATHNEATALHTGRDMATVLSAAHPLRMRGTPRHRSSNGSTHSHTDEVRNRDGAVGNPDGAVAHLICFTGTATAIAFDLGEPHHSSAAYSAVYAALHSALRFDSTPLHSPRSLSTLSSWGRRN